MRIASKNPPRCSVCFEQKPKEVHVDFNVAFDGPVIPGQPLVSIDDLIVCKSCLKQAAKLIGMSDKQELENKYELLSEAIKDYEVELEQKDGVIGDLVHTLEVVVSKGVKRLPRRPKIEAIDPELSEYIKENLIAFKVKKGHKKSREAYKKNLEEKKQEQEQEQEEETVEEQELETVPSEKAEVRKAPTVQELLEAANIEQKVD